MQAYEFDIKALRLKQEYLSNGIQRTNIGQYGSWEEIKHGVPEGSILGSTFFYNDLPDLPDVFFIMKDVDILQ